MTARTYQKGWFDPEPASIPKPCPAMSSSGNVDANPMRCEAAG